MQLPNDIQTTVARALAEDIGTGDVTAGLIPADKQASATVISREDATLCGVAWFNEVFRQLDPAVQIDWQYQDGDRVEANALLCSLRGSARSILSGERAALNFLQTLSATATATRRYVELVAHTQCRILDTRKTLPGLRTAQKYAVLCGGGTNHRIGLYDRVLIKENHIMAAGSITAAIQQARQLHPGILVEVETENLQELAEASAAQADIIMLDEYSLADMREAVRVTAGSIPLEASGGVSPETLVAIAETGVDFVSIGGITKHVRAVDLSMRFNA
ncbi:carboxylating nicotinate-nucleotide diphosphorylase [Thiothrix litoralis]|uniref:nicotinate-nucleotide diphosphorylase (carboxylating) n=2 Tax=Thiothrix TaxID=1030 RepID=A0ABY9MMD3_9GAMM|nr:MULTISPECIES: carboxylating nicotinate-nucleotide diphosphorylase [Thiothrix]QTR46134.1 carboxylating nicotinate-nucleotide diphosphorylase [Thiothrix litoralis]WML89697.1 carboxylating nicotinate-nucleotide diphosphorylase [Thiothrix lacustris]